jgi:MFS family permease
MAEAIAGVGLMFGPVIGAFLYSAFGYFLTFFAFGLILSVNLVVTYFITPEFLNKTESSGNDGS